MIRVMVNIIWPVGWQWFFKSYELLGRPSWADLRCWMSEWSYMVQKYRRMLKPAFLGLVVLIELVTGVHLDSYLSTCQVNASDDKIFFYIDYFLLPSSNFPVFSSIFLVCLFEVEIEANKKWGERRIWHATFPGWHQTGDSDAPYHSLFFKCCILVWISLCNTWESCNNDCHDIAAALVICQNKKIMKERVKLLGVLIGSSKQTGI